MTTLSQNTGSIRSILATSEVLSSEDIQKVISSYKENLAVKEDLEARASSLDISGRRRLRVAAREADRNAEAIIRSMIKLSEVIVREMLERRYGKNGYSESMHDDLISEGCSCIMEAAHKYDSSKGPSFSTWAGNVIRNRIRALVMDGTHSSVRVPNSWSRMRRVALLQFSELNTQLGRPPSTAELQDRMMEVCLQWGLDHLPASMDDASQEEREEAAIKKLRKQGMLAALREIDAVLVTGLHPVLLDSPIHSDSGSTLSEMLPDEEAHLEMVAEVEGTALRDTLSQALAPYPERERDIVLQRWGIIGDGPKSFKEIGQEFDISAERVRQIEEGIRKGISKDPTFAPKLLSFLRPDESVEDIESAVKTSGRRRRVVA